MRLLQVVAIALVVATLLASSPLASANNISDIDDDHKLGREAPENWGPTAHSDLIAPDVTITVAEKAEDCGWKGKSNDAANTYVCVEYREEIDRTLRFDIHKSYMTRINKEGFESIDGDATANFEPREDHTRVSIDVDGPTTAIFGVNKVESETQGWWRKWGERGDKAKDSILGDLFGSSDEPEYEWEYYEDHELADEELVINHSREDIQLEYDSDPGEDAKWRVVPDSPTKKPPVYWYSKDGEDKTRVVSTDVNGTPVRVKEGGQKGFWAKGWDDLWSVDRGPANDDDWWPFW